MRTLRVLEVRPAGLGFPAAEGPLGVVVRLGMWASLSALELLALIAHRGGDGSVGSEYPEP
jgi:hypothetical protein